jgi:alcohol dehydrogenase (cytochrome c)
MRSRTPVCRGTGLLIFAATGFAASLAAQAPAPASPGVPNAPAITGADVAGGLKNPARWLTYSGDYTGQRHSPLKQITAANVGQLAAQWTFQNGIALAGQKFETSPLVIDGVMYATGALNYAWAIDAKTGRQLWRYQRQLPATQNLKVCCGLVNRGFAVLGDRLFMTTLDAHLVALDMKTGKEIWATKLADYQQGYASTVAPLVVKDKIIVGIAGGEFAIRGFLDAYDPLDGKQLWRFWTVPAPGEPGSESWPKEVNTWERGGGPTWLTGTYDPELNLIYWGTGNPNPDFYGADRKGDNLFTNSLVALDADTGTLKWHFQFTPFDEHDWDANQIPVLTDLNIAGRTRKVVMVANRNGFLYVLDRATGQYIAAKPYIRTTWAKEIASNGRPIEEPNQRPTAEGTTTCPDLFGGTNFMSPSFDVGAGLFFLTARETCQVYITARPPEGYKMGDRTMGGSVRPAPERGYGALRAIDPTTGDRKWEVRHPTPSWAGVLSTAGGVVFSGTNEGDVFAVDSRTGKELWRFQVGAPLYAPPITYMIDNRQHVAIAAGTTITAFALPQGK